MHVGSSALTPASLPIEHVAVARPQAEPAFRLRIAPAPKGVTLPQRVHHMHVEQRLRVDSIAPPHSHDGVWAQLKNTVPEEFHDTMDWLIAEYAAIGIYSGTRNHYSRAFSAIDEAKRQIFRGNMQAMNAVVRRLLIMLNSRKP